MSLPFVPGIAERMEELGYDQLLRAYEDKYGKKYPPFRMEIHKEGGLAYMEELRAQFPGENLDELIERYTDHRSEEEKRAELDALVDLSLIHISGLGAAVRRYVPVRTDAEHRQKHAGYRHAYRLPAIERMAAARGHRP